MIKRLQQIAQWFDDRLHLTKLFESTAGHHVPKSSGSWFYVFGSGTMLCLMLQLVTGTCLAFVYVPSADEAYLTLEYLTYQQPLGWFLRALHYWGSNFMVGIMAADGMLVFRYENGKVALVKADPKKFEVTGSFDIPQKSGKPSWQHPVIANGRLYLRDQDKLHCYDILKPGS